MCSWALSPHLGELLGHLCWLRQHHSLCVTSPPQGQVSPQGSVPYWSRHRRFSVQEAQTQGLWFQVSLPCDLRHCEERAAPTTICITVTVSLVLSLQPRDEQKPCFACCIFGATEAAGDPRVLVIIAAYLSLSRSSDRSRGGLPGCCWNQYMS